MLLKIVRNTLVRSLAAGLLVQSVPAATTNRLLWAVVWRDLGAESGAWVYLCLSDTDITTCRGRAQAESKHHHSNKAIPIPAVNPLQGEAVTK